MRALFLVVWLALAAVMHSQASWRSLDTFIQILDPTLLPARLTPEQTKAIVRYLERGAAPGCVASADGEGGAHFYSAPLGRPNIVYVVSAPRCHGSANGPLWLFDLSGGRTRQIASMGGWGFGVQPETSHGLHDFVVGWHWSAFETGLTWFRFDGRIYRKVSDATMYTTDDEGQRRMAEAREHCKALKQGCNLILSKQSD